MPEKSLTSNPDVLISFTTARMGPPTDAECAPRWTSAKVTLLGGNAVYRKR